jgi:hypothetical protein
VKIHHTNLGNVWSYYDHMGAGNIRVANGQRVTQGQFIGYIGSDQAGGTPHVHFAVNVTTTGNETNTNVDPSPYLNVDVSYPRPPNWGAPITTNCPNQPLPDTDGDGIPDSADSCANEAEDLDGFQDSEGCPEPDFDVEYQEGIRADFNGDGRSDLFHACCADYADLWFGQADGSLVHGNLLQPGSGYGVQQGTWRVGDFNGDGRSDLVHLCCADYADLWFGQADGSFVHGNLLQPGSGYGLQPGTWRVGDFNGDGRSDLFHACCAEYGHVWFGQADGTMVQTQFLSPGSGYGMQNGNWRVGDFNGDGRSDLAHLCCADYADLWFGQADSSFVHGNLLQPGSGYALQPGMWRIGDFNGDGRSDLFHACCAEYGHVWFGQADGTMVQTQFLSPGSGYGMQNGNWRVGDFNGDGRSDLVHLCCADYTELWFGQANGAFSHGQLLSPGSGYGMRPGSWRVSDVNGDGMSDLFHICCGDYGELWFGQGNGTFADGQFMGPGSGYGMQAGRWFAGDYTGDRDGDTWLDAVDNCLTIRNIDQADFDGDQSGNACDTDDDNDGIADANELTYDSDPLNAASMPEGPAADAALSRNTCDGLNNDLDVAVDEGFTNTDGDTQSDCVDQDDDADACPDSQEAQTAVGSELTGGRRDPLNANDYFNPSHDGKNRIDDVLAVVDAYFIDAGNPAYNADTDRTLVGPNAWNLGPPNGLQRIDDVVNIVKQYFHDCG